MKIIFTKNRFSTAYIINVTILLVFSQCSHSVKSLKILALVPTSLSHFKFIEPVLHGLADVGHDVTVYGNYPRKNASSNYHDVDLNIPGFEEFKGFPLNEGYIEARLKLNYFFEFYVLKSIYDNICPETYKLEAIQKLINSKEKYDVILVEYFASSCLLGVTWKLQAPVIGLSSCTLPPWHYESFGNPMLPSFMPSLLSPYSSKMSFSDRFFNFINVNGLKLLHQFIVRPQTNTFLREQFGNDIPPIDEIERNASLIFVNTHYSVHSPKPYLPSVVEIGGVHMKEDKPIEPKMKKILDEATEGIVYFSWGSGLLVSTMHEEKLAALLKAFGSLKQKVLLKWETDHLDNKPDNVIVSKWFQQQDILCHPNVKVFFTHGGLMGSTEAIHCGTPVIPTPFFADQYLNAASFAEHGMGQTVSYNNFTVEAILEAVEFALDPKTQLKAKKVSQAFRDRLNTPLDTAIWWVEHVAKTGGAPLIKSHGIDLNRFVYYSLDVISVLVGGLILWILISIWVIRKICCSKKANTLKANKLKIK